MIPSLQVIASRELGGAESAFQRTVGALHAAGHPVQVALRRGAELDRVLPPALPRLLLGMRSYFDFATMLELRAALKTGQWPVVQTWMSRATWLTHAPRGVLHVARLGGYYRPRYFRHAHGWVVNTRGLYEWMLQQGFPQERLAWINNFVPALPPGTPSPLSREQLGIPAEALLLVSLGRLITKKGFQDLIAAFAALPAVQGGQPLHLLLMGEGSLRGELEAQARAAGVQGRIHFAGWQDQALAALPIADLFVCPSREEPLGNVILEAWSQRMPVVSTATAGGQELIVNGENGLLAPLADAQGLAATLRRALGSAALREQLAGRGYERFSQGYSEQATVTAYLDFYARMLRTTGVAAGQR